MKNLENQKGIIFQDKDGKIVTIIRSDDDGVSISLQSEFHTFNPTYEQVVQIVDILGRYLKDGGIHIFEVAKPVNGSKPIDEFMLRMTDRGFIFAEFTDAYGMPCIIRKSSSATSDRIWLGAREIGLQEFKAGEGWNHVKLAATQEHHFVANNRMHLGIEEVEQLLPILHQFVATGELHPGDDQSEEVERLTNFDVDMEVKGWIDELGQKCSLTDKVDYLNHLFVESISGGKYTTLAEIEYIAGKIQNFSDQNWEEWQ